MSQDAKKWYYGTYVLVIAFLCIGPLALPLAWTNPRFSVLRKIVITAIMIIISIYMAFVVMKSMQSINSYYQQMMKLSQYK